MTNAIQVIPELGNIDLMSLKTETCPDYNIEDVLKERTYFGRKTQEVLNIVTLKENTLPVGSARFDIHRYPSDIDLFENIIGCCTLNKVRKEVIEELRNIILYVNSNPSYIFAEFKAGYDKRYKIYIGEERLGKIVDYDQYIALLQVENLYSQKLLTRVEYETFKSLLPKSMDLNTFQELEEYMRSFYVLRWSVEEILQGYKDLRGNNRMYLFNALIDKSVVKLDLWISLPYEFLDNECFQKEKKKLELTSAVERYVEVTNWMLIQYKNLDGDIKTLTQDLPNYASSLRSDIWKYTDPNNPNWLKATKRFWTYLLFKFNQSKDNSKLQWKKYPSSFNELNKKSKSISSRSKDLSNDVMYVKELILDIAPLFGSYIALINAIYGDLEVVKDILNLQNDTKDIFLTKDYYVQTMKSLRLRLKCTKDLCLENKDVSRTLEDALFMLEKSYNNMEYLDSVLVWLNDIINQTTLSYLKNKNINLRKILFST